MQQTPGLEHCVPSTEAATRLMPKCCTTSSSCPCASSVLNRKSAPSPGRAAKRWSRVTNMRPSAVACAMQAGTCLRCVSGLMCSESTPRDLQADGVRRYVGDNLGSLTCAAGVS